MMNDSAEDRAKQALDTRIAELVGQIREHQEQITDLEDEIRSAKEQLLALLERRGENWADDYGYARLVSEGIRISYDTKALDELIIKDPLRYGWLKDYRREASVQGTIQVK